MSEPGPPAGRRQPTILVVDDEDSFVSSLAHVLSREGYQILSAGDGPTALATARERRPDVILLDLMLPGMHGLDVCRGIRELGDPQPGIIMVTAKDSDMDAVVGLESGADDYVAKPFNMGLLLARVRALLRRTKMADRASAAGGNGGRRILVGDLAIEADAYVARCRGNELDLSPRLFEVLFYLATNRCRVISRDELLDRVWGYDYAGQTRTVDVHVHLLRQALDDGGCGDPTIETIRGVGYRLVVGD